MTRPSTREQQRPDAVDEPGVMDGFHPAVAAWFERTHGTPTDPQRLGWPAIREGRHTLIAAPTGTGKTLAAFLAAIDGLVRRAEQGRLETALQVVYVSPLKALSADIEKNLAEPLAGIEAELKARGTPAAGIRVALRTGDTTASQREGMLRRPPHILVTTPESLFILLTSRRGRGLLRPARTVIVDEIHALMGDKRGAHLALTLERLEALTAQGEPEMPLIQDTRTSLARIGLSATQKPIGEVARFLVGTAGRKDAAEAPPDCTIVDTGHVRERDLALELPSSPLESVMSGETWAEVYSRLADLVEAHRTTLIFVNTRRLAERAARHLSERLGEDNVTAHHGSMSKEHRLDAEQRLKSGRLRALVATASLELGIDVGAIDLVCQIGSTKSIAAFLQRVGRSGHTREGVPKGRLFPLTRDELVECAALLDAVRREELDRLLMPGKPLDILAQQIVAETACGEQQGRVLFDLLRRAWPFRELTRTEFDQVVDMLARGYRTGRGRHGAYLYHDAVNDRIRARKNARHAAIVSGGAIPELAAYDVVLEPGGTRIGSLDEDFAIESLPGDIFQLGNTSWRILRIQTGVVRVEDAHGQPPNIPFWLGEAPGRSDELSHAVSRLRETVDTLLAQTPPAGVDAAPLRPASLAGLPEQGPPDNGDAPATRFVPDGHPLLDYLTGEVGLPPEGALQLAEYLASARAALGTLPTQSTLVLERFFDEAGGMQLVIHAPFGSRLNRAWGLALRKRFCRSFNFELQAAAIEDAIVLSLGPTHSFALDEVYRYLKSGTARGVLVQALLDAPMFTVRWRWNANRALAVLRRVGDRKIPAQLQRMRSDDLLALVFPDQQACLENIVGDREIPDHPLVGQTLRDCLEEAMDANGLEVLLRRMEAGQVRLEARDLREPSPLAAEILNARPYAFLDDAPLEERRTRAVQSRRWLDPETASSLAALDGEAIARVCGEAWPEVGDADELHEALLLLGALREDEAEFGWPVLLDRLSDEGRATVMDTALETGPGGARFWVAAEWLPQLQALYPQARLIPEIPAPPALGGQEARTWTTGEAALELLRARLEACGPVTAAALAEALCLSGGQVTAALAALESEGFAFRGRYTPGAKQEEWCERGLLARIHRYTLNRLRAEIEPVSAADFMRFLFAWHRLTPERRAEGLDGLAGVVELLEGCEAPAAAWEPELLAARLNHYDPEWLDRLCAMGQVAWLRLTPPAGNSAGGGNGGERGGVSRRGRPRRAGPVASTPIALVNRANLSLWRAMDGPGLDDAGPDEEADATRDEGLSAQARAVQAHLAARGASFFDELTAGAGLLPTHAEAALGELVALGRVTSDSYAGLRALLRPARKRPPVRPGRPGGKAGSRTGWLGLSPQGAGRWSLTGGTPPPPDADVSPRPGSADPSVEALAWVLLRRYGVVFRRLLEREGRTPPWRELVRVYRRLEARGEIRGGRFVGGMAGEQYALPEAVGTLREVRRQPGTGHLLSLSAADPLNLSGILTPGRRVPALTANRVLYRDGVPIACQEAGQPHFLEPVPPGEEWVLSNALKGRLPGAPPVTTGNGEQNVSSRKRPPLLV